MAATFNQHLDSFGLWKKSISSIIDDYQTWLDEHHLSSTEIERSLTKSTQLLEKSSITVAFTAEFSRGKTELINALFFSEMGLRVLPSSPGRTTMCPTEIFYDAQQKPYLRLLDIKTRLTDSHIDDFKKSPEQWTQITLDCDSPESMRNAFLALLETVSVPAIEAEELGFPQESEQSQVEIPRWRHALISFPHPLLQSGLTILDTPGLNALGSEPELTLKMLPNAQAMIFVLAADTGVTQSDMDMWQQHVRGYRNKHPSSLAVVLNKIDSLQDDLMSDDEVYALIHKQVEQTGQLLKLDEHSIFPVSAKQALVGKIKKDALAIDQSQISSLESFLSDEVVGSQADILMSTVVEEIIEKTKETESLLSSRINSTESYLLELNSIYHQSEKTTSELILSTRKEQTSYNKNIAHLETSQRIFANQIAELKEIIKPSRAQTIIKDAAHKMRKRWTSIGIRQSMQGTFDELNTMLNETLNSTSASIKLINAIYAKFKEAHQLISQQPAHFDITPYRQQLELLFIEGIEFSNSSNAAFTEQNTLVNRFIDTIGGRAVEIFNAALIDVKNWNASALAPLIAEVNDQKEAVEKRLDSLKKVASGKDSLEAKLIENQTLLTDTEYQLKQLQELTLRLDTPLAYQDSLDGLEYPQEKVSAQH